MSVVDIHSEVSGKGKSIVRTSDVDTNPVPQPEEIEQRIGLIQAFSLQGDIAQPAPDAWKETIGMFDGDAVFKEISDAGKAIRDSQRDA